MKHLLAFCLSLWVALAVRLDGQKTLYQDTSKDVQFGSSIAYIPPTWSNVLSAKNFNRNVSVAMWQTQMVNPDKDCLDGMKGLLNVSFIVYDDSFYDVSHFFFSLPKSIHIKGLKADFCFPLIASRRQKPYG